MIEMSIGRRSVQTVFDLLGSKENDLTYSIGWAMKNVPAFTERFLEDVFGDDPGDVVSINLQQVDSGGITDIEILTNRAHLIIEAKRGWVLPADAQLGRYAPRLGATKLPLRRLLALTECSAEYASRHLPSEIGGIKVDHRSWPELIVHASGAEHGVGSHQERHLAQELVRYLKGATSMQDPTSNLAYCVALGAEYQEEWPFTPRQVLDTGIYFHPFGWGHGWPKTPANFLAFRWDGQLRDARHVESTIVVDDLHDEVPMVPSVRNLDRPFLVYRLGPSIPFTPLPAGVRSDGRKISYRNTRFWVALDLILTSSSMQEAINKTKTRSETTGA
jgi:hypothetical protein